MPTPRRKFIGYSLIAAFVVAVFCILPYHYQDCATDPQTKKEECATYQVAGFIALKTGRFLDDHSGAIVAIFTFVLAASTIALWAATWCGIKGQQRETRILQRAYVSAEPQGISPFKTPGTFRVVEHCFVGHVGIRNVGNLPAKNIRWFIDSTYSPSGNYDWFPIIETEFHGGGNVLPPGVIMTQRSKECPLYETEGYIFVWGQVLYTDGFGADRHTTFCHRYNLARLEMIENEARIRKRYGRHNHKGNDAT